MPSTGFVLSQLAIVIAVIILPPASASATQVPSWVDAYRQGSLVSADHYLGVGAAQYQSNTPNHDTLRLSKDRALDDLCYQLSVSISSKLEEKLSQKGSYSHAQISSSLFVSTRKVLNGISERQKWTDTSQQRHWVLLAIDKQSAQRQVQQQDFIQRVIDRMEKNQSEIKQGVHKLNRLFTEQTHRIDQRMQNLESLLNKINQKLDTATNEAQTESRPFVQKFENIARQWQNRKTLPADPLLPTKQLMHRNQTHSQQLAQMMTIIQTDHFLPFLEDDLKTQMVRPDFKVSITPQKGENAEYVAGETVRFLVRADRNAFIKVIYSQRNAGGNHGQTLNNTLLFPNAHDRDNHIRANQTVTIGRKGELTVEPPFGKDIITVVAATTQFDDIETLLKDSQQYYAFETRSIKDAVSARGIGVKQKAAVITDTCFIFSRPK